jgi:hypothetical protein
MSNHNNLWVFGDSFSVPFKRVIDDSPYIPYKGYCPKVYGDIISENLNLNYMDMSIGGCSNQTMFHNFIKNFEKIKPNDIVIFGWTQIIRFRIASKKNDLFDVLIAVADQMGHFIDIEKNALDHIHVNRMSYSVYFDELCDFIKIINHTCKNNKVLHWTWVEPTSNISTDEKKYERKYFDLLVPYKKYLTVKEETNGKVLDFHYGETAHKNLAEDLLKFL